MQKLATCFPVSRVLEEHEEDLTAAIQKGVLEEEEGEQEALSCVLS